MKIIYTLENIKNKEDDQSLYYLFCFSGISQKDITEDIVYNIVKPKDIFKYNECNEIVVDIVKSEDMKRLRCGSVYDMFKFYGDGFKGDDIMFAITRFRPQIANRRIPLEDDIIVKMKGVL